MAVTKAHAKSRGKRRAQAKPARRSRAARPAVARSRATRRGPRKPAVSRQITQKFAKMAAEQMVPADAIALLEQDHREAEAFFAQFEQEDAGKAELAHKICLALTVHTRIEEEIFYPAARKVAEKDLLDEAEVEHAAAKKLIAEIEAMRPRDRLFDAKVKVLGEYVKHHVQEEETELFPALRKTDLDLLALGRRMAERRIELLNGLARAA